MENPFEKIHYSLEQIQEKLADLETVKSQLSSLGLSQQGTIRSHYRLTRKEVCERFKISYPTLHKLMSKGSLSYEKIGRKTLFNLQEVEGYFSSNKVEGGVKK